jgi:predicted flap endonuclease-1-like 5' DNA nuclease
MKWLIALLTAATGLLHILVGFNVIGGGTGGTLWMLVANGAGYLVLLALFLTTSGSTRRTIRWILLAYTLITLIGYFVLNWQNPNMLSTWPMVIKAIELLLVILLLLDRGSDEVAVPVAARTAGTVDMTVPPASTTAGAPVATAAVVADQMVDRTTEPTDETIDALPETLDRAAETVDEDTGMVPDAGEDVIVETSRMDDAVVDAGEAAGALAASALAAAVVAGDDDQTMVGDEPTSEDTRANLEKYLKSFGPSSEFNRDIEYIEGVGQAYGDKLRAAGVNKVFDLVVNASTRRDRKHLSDSSGIAQSLILTWVNHVDLFRIKGVAQEYADLLEQSGVDTVVELAQRNPVNLHKRMAEINEEKKLVRRLPHASDVQSWVEQAKELPRLIYY